MTRFSPDVRERWLDVLRTAGRDISRALGYSGDEPGGVVRAPRNGVAAR